MSTLLRIYIDENWPARPSLPWVLLDPAGKVLAQGESDALRWPAADVCEAILALPQVSSLHAEIPPRISRRDLGRVVAGTIEAKLPEEVERCHLSLGNRQRNTVEVMVVARSRMRDILAQCTALNRPLSAAYSEAQCLPHRNDEWTVVVGHEKLMVVGSGTVPLVFDVLDEPVPSVLFDALRSLELPGEPPRPIRLLPRSGVDINAAHWQVEEGRSVRVGEAYAWHVLAPGARDLLHGEFASTHRKSDLWLAVRPALVAAAWILGAYVVIDGLQLATQWRSVASAEERKLDVFRSAFPNAPVVAPLAQARRALDEVRGVHGIARTDSALAYLADVSEVLGSEGEGALKEASFADHRMTLVLGPEHQASATRLKDVLGHRGYQIGLQPADPEGTKLILERSKSK